MSTEASDSIAFSCCASAPSRRHPQRRGRVGERGEQDQPLRHERDEAGHCHLDRGTGTAALLPERDDEQDPERHGDRDEHVEQDVQRALQRRVGVAELPRLAGDPLRVASLADRAHDVGARPLDDERARAHLVARGTHDGPRLAREDRLVERERVGLVERAVGDDLVAGRDADEIAFDHLLDRELALLAVPHDRRPRRHERRRAGRAPASRAAPARSRYPSSRRRSRGRARRASRRRRASARRARRARG